MSCKRRFMSFCTVDVSLALAARAADSVSWREYSQLISADSVMSIRMQLSLSLMIGIGDHSFTFSSNLHFSLLYYLLLTLLLFTFTCRCSLNRSTLCQMPSKKFRNKITPLVFIRLHHAHAALSRQCVFLLAQLSREWAAASWIFWSKSTVSMLKFG